MKSRHLISATALFCAVSLSLSFQPAHADEVATDSHPLFQAGASLALIPSLLQQTGSLVNRAGDGVQKLLDGALELVGIRYRRGGSNAETGFDCSGFVGYVFRERLGLDLPRTSREISRVGEEVTRADLEPGDLVFFKTMRQAFSHVGIYLGNNQFVHAPRTGQAVRVEDMRSSYWARRYNGARRIEG